MLFLKITNYVHRKYDLGGFVCKFDIIHQTEDSLVLYNINPSFSRIKATAIGLNLTELPLWGTTGKYSQHL